MGGGDGWGGESRRGKMETAVLEQQLKKKFVFPSLNYPFIHSFVHSFIHSFIPTNADHYAEHCTQVKHGLHC